MRPALSCASKVSSATESVSRSLIKSISICDGGADRKPRHSQAQRFIGHALRRERNQRAGLSHGRDTALCWVCQIQYRDASHKPISTRNQRHRSTLKRLNASGPNAQKARARASVSQARATGEKAVAAMSVCTSPHVSSCWRRRSLRNVPSVVAARLKCFQHPQPVCAATRATGDAAPLPCRWWLDPL